MKKYTLFFLLILSTTTFGQSNFSNGFNNGYKKGFCQNQGIGCIEPLPPTAPIPGTNEKENSYQDGYNRGFEAGLNSQKASNSNDVSTRERFKAQSVELSKDNIYQPDYNLLRQKNKSLDDLIDSGLKSMENKDFDIALEKADKIIIIEPNAKLIAYFIKSRVYTYRNQNPILAYNYGIYSKSFWANVDERSENVFEKTLIEDVETYLSKFMFKEDYKNLEIACSNVWYETEYINLLHGYSYYFQNDFNKAKKYFKKSGDYESAEKYLESIKNKTALPNPFLDIVSNSKNQQSATNAVTAENRKENPNDIFSNALSKSENNDYSGAIIEYDKLILIGTNGQGYNYDLATVYNNKAYALTNLKRYNEALPLVIKALGFNKNYWFIWDTKGEIEFNLGNYNQCIIDMSNATKINNYGNSLYFRGLSYILTNKKVLGCKDLTEAGKLGKKEAYYELNKYCK